MRKKFPENWMWRKFLRKIKTKIAFGKLDVKY